MYKRQIIDSNDISLYQQLAESKYVIGVFSTVMYEALDFDCEILLLDLPGIEYMGNLIGQKKAKLLKDGDVEILKSLDRCQSFRI